MQPAFEHPIQSFSLSVFHSFLIQYVSPCNWRTMNSIRRENKLQLPLLTWTDKTLLHRFIWTLKNQNARTDAQAQTSEEQTHKQCKRWTGGEHWRSASVVTDFWIKMQETFVAFRPVLFRPSGRWPLALYCERERDADDAPAAMHNAEWS
jgi:hypothetical protein